MNDVDYLQWVCFAVNRVLRPDAVSFAPVEMELHQFVRASQTSTRYRYPVRRHRQLDYTQHHQQWFVILGEGKVVWNLDGAVRRALLISYKLFIVIVPLSVTVVSNLQYKLQQISPSREGTEALHNMMLLKAT